MPVLLPDEGVVKLHEWNIKPKPLKPQICPPEAKRLAEKVSSLSGPTPITWMVSDIAKAGCLLTTPPISTHFDDEQEMRRVYTLIYDVFRYKNILNQALTDVSFFIIFPELNKSIPLVWLLLFDLYHRSFKKRETSVAETATNLFEECGLLKAEKALWSQRIKLAAAVARLRIQHSALRLNELLPRHLRDERISTQANSTPVTCWVNVKKVKNLEEINRDLEKVLNMKPVNDIKYLEPDTFKWDKLCPQFIAFHPSVRTKLAQCALVRKHKLVVQDRSFCLGPATFGKLIEDLQLTGCVIQTHVNSPRSTAYLAALLSQNDKVKKLMAFSAGSRKTEYEKYFSELGMNNVIIYSDKLIDIPPDAFYLQEAIAVFATPPNSYSAVSDPIDLVCSRGGDLSMLEVLTESEETTEGRQRVLRILEEQRNTLRFAMSRPQIQFVLYETHSELEAENTGMVQKAVKEINKLAKMHHAAQQGKLHVPSSHSELIATVESKEINYEKMDTTNAGDRRGSIATIGSKRPSIASKISKESFDSDEKFFKDVVVPDCDLFDVPNLPDLCPNEDYCLQLSEEGCFLALLQRKQVTRMDNKYLIQIAESRGLFGNNDGAPRTKGSKAPRKKQERVVSPPTKIRRKIKQSEELTALKQFAEDICKLQEQWKNSLVWQKSLGKPLTQEKSFSETETIEENDDEAINMVETTIMDIVKATVENNTDNNQQSDEEVTQDIPKISPEELEERCKLIEELEDRIHKQKFYSIKTNPYKILKSLTSHQIRALISPAYNATNDILNTLNIKSLHVSRSRNTLPESELEPEPILKLPSVKSDLKRKRQYTPVRLLRRICRPTQASLTRAAAEEDDDFEYGTIIKQPKFKCELCRKRNMNS